MCASDGVILNGRLVLSGFKARSDRCVGTSYLQHRFVVTIPERSICNLLKT